MAVVQLFLTVLRRLPANALAEQDLSSITRNKRVLRAVKSAEVRVNTHVALHSTMLVANLTVVGSRHISRTGLPAGNSGGIRSYESKGPRQLGRVFDWHSIVDTQEPAVSACRYQASQP